MVFKNEKQLKEFLLSKCKIALTQVEERIYRVIDGALQQYYSEFEPDEYIRTQQLLHSLVKSDVKRVGDRYEAEVYFDGSSMHYETQHVLRQSGWYGSATWGADEVLDTAMNGSHGGYIDGTAIWGTSHAVLGDIYMLIKKELIAQGIPIK